MLTVRQLQSARRVFHASRAAPICERHQGCEKQKKQAYSSKVRSSNLAHFAKRVLPYVLERRLCSSMHGHRSSLEFMT